MTRLAVGLLLVWVEITGVSAGGSEYTEARRALVAEIEADVRETSLYLDKETLDARVMRAIASVPRHEFVPKRSRKHAYDNRPVPIGHGQTISQPYIVAVMTDLLKLKAGDRVLEIGTGSGYQAAVLAELTDSVYSIEIVEPLGRSARERLSRLGYDKVKTRISDGYYGWEEHAPFDAIIVTAAAGYVPPPLIRQLRPDGRMVIPVGSRFMTQQLVLITKGQEGELKTRQILPVRFVPLTGEHK